MSDKKVKCLFCQTENNIENDNCEQCGMVLSKNPSDSVKNRRSRFLKLFWFTVIFCVVMMFYLPR